VYWVKGSGKWKAVIIADGKHRHLGCFTDEAEAAASYARAAAARAQGKILPAYTGVSYDKGQDRWTARIVVDRKHRHLGSFKQEEEATKAYRDAADALAQGRAIPARHQPTSTHRGVYWVKGSGKWRAVIIADGRHKHLGCFADEAEAAAAYMAAAAAIAQGKAVLPSASATGPRGGRSSGWQPSHKIMKVN
jgi:hypothetical protein